MTAEELRDELLLGVKRKDYTWLRMKTDSLIAAARAEGAEQERERIRKAGIPVDNIKFSMDGKVMHIMELTTDGRDTMPSYFVPASVLTPKEKS